MTAGSETLRTFIALPLPDEWIGQLGATITDLSRALPHGVRWVSPDGIHLTLKFLGATDSRAVPRILDAIAENFAGASSPLLSLSVLGTFPGGRNPRVIWAGVSGGAEGLEDLHRRAEQPVSGLGWSMDGRPFRPHLTLGRGVIGSTRGNARRYPIPCPGPGSRLSVAGVPIPFGCTGAC